MPALRLAVLPALAIALLVTTAGRAHAAPLADEATPSHLRAIPARVDTIEYAGKGQAVDALLAVAGWEVEGLGEHIAARLAPPPIVDPAPPWAPPPALLEGAPPPPPSTATAVVLLDEASMAILCQRAPHDRLAPASLTKVATAALAVQSGRMDEVVHNSVESWSMPGSSLMGLHSGDEFTLRDLVYGLMLPSGNDAALSIARHLAGDDGLFVYYLNQMVQRLGLQDTHFTDPHGLGGPHHYSSAYDLAVITRYAMQHEEYRYVAGALGWTAEGSRSIAMASYVAPFIEAVPGADGGKTGFTYEAGPTFIGSASRGGHRLYVVLLNSQDRFGEAAALLDWAFANHTWSSTMSVAAAPSEDDGVVEAAQHKP